MLWKERQKTPEGEIEGNARRRERRKRQKERGGERLAKECEIIKEVKTQTNLGIHKKLTRNEKRTKKQALEKKKRKK